MDSKSVSPREKFKAKPRPVKKTKETKQREPESKVSSTARHKMSYSKGGLKKNDKDNFALDEDKEIDEKNKKDVVIPEENKTNYKIVDASEPVIIIPSEPLEIKKSGLPLLLDDIKITEGNKQIRITLTKQKNRMVRLQVFYNGVEIRPSTFTGNNPAQNYWELLKGLERK